MAIDAKQITTEITLELDEDEISIVEFSKAFDNFFGLIKEISKEVAPRKDASAWLIKVYPGSAGIGVIGKPGVYTQEERDIIRKNIIDGLRSLEHGQRPPLFSDKAIEFSRALGNLFKSKATPPSVRIWDQAKPVLPISRAIVYKAGELLEAAYEDDGSVDGFLEKLSAHGQFEFVVYDSLNGRPIKCEVEEEKLQAAWSAFRQRVEVVGKVRYRKDGLPVSVRAKEIIPFPSKDEIPSLEEMRKLLS